MSDINIETTAQTVKMVAKGIGETGAMAEVDIYNGSAEIELDMDGSLDVADINETIAFLEAVKEALEQDPPTVEL